MIQLDALQTIDRTNKLCWCRFELLLPILCYLTICPDFIFLLFTCCFNSSKLNLNFIWRWCWWIDVSIKKLEKLEAAKVAYLWLPFVTFCYLSLPFLTFPYLSYSTFVLQAVRLTRLEQGCDQSHLLSELGNTAEAATTRSGLMEWGSD